MQISEQKVSRHIHEQMIKNMLIVLMSLRSQSDAQQLFTDFLSPTEQIVLAKRLMIAQYLHDGKSYEEIRATLHVSTATISSIANILHKPGIQVALQKIHDDAWAEKILDKFLPRT